MALNVTLLRQSFEMVLDRAPDLTRRFYDRLFARHPETRALFSRQTRDRQERMLAEALVAVMDHLDDAPWLAENLRALGAKHASYGVTDEMYGFVGEALLGTLADVTGDAWTDAHHRAWLDAFEAIASLMKTGARELS